MNDLIERLEKAMVPDRELDLSILCAISGKPWRWHVSFPAQTTITWDRYGENAPGNPICSIEEYTGSIDDALTLVPADAGWSISDYKTSSCDAFVHLPDELRSASGQTPAIALCIAALKARAP